MQSSPHGRLRGELGFLQETCRAEAFTLPAALFGGRERLCVLARGGAPLTQQGRQRGAFPYRPGPAFW